jgi:hypothetical protein
MRKRLLGALLKTASAISSDLALAR